jgi:adenosylcobinamide-GDP ribazoletransferase
MIAAFRLSLGLFTVVPAGPRGSAEPTRSRVRAAILLAPVVGLLIGLGAAVGEALLRWLLLGLGQPGVAENPLVALLGAAFALGAMQLVVGGMHLDGLADTVDGLAAGGGRSRILEVMRRSDIGPMGVIAVVFTPWRWPSAAATARSPS